MTDQAFKTRSKKRTYTAIQLAKYYEVGNTDMALYEYIVDTFAVGQPQQAKRIFTQLTRKDRKEFIKAAVTDWKTGLSDAQIKALIDLI